MPRPRQQNIGRRSRNYVTQQSHRRSQSEEAHLQRNVVQHLRNEHRTTSAGLSVNPASRRTSRISRRAQAMEFAAFQYIGGMTMRYIHCAAAKFPGETAGMCCTNDKVKLPAFESPPDPLHSLIFGTSPTSKNFLSHIQEYNTPFQMTSFGATKVIRDSFMPTFKVIISYGISFEKCNLTSNYFDIFTNSDPISNCISHMLQIQAQIYLRAGSLLPFPDTEPQFLQIYFVGNSNDELNRRCAIAPSARRQIILDLQIFFHQHNELVQLFKIALDLMPSDNHRIVISKTIRHLNFLSLYLLMVATYQARQLVQ
jgi:hypothetical protein